jgi:hypothetical protein
MTALGDFSSGDVLTAADMNAIGTWTTFTPVWTNVTVGNGTVTAEYCQVNELVFWRVFLEFGSTTAFSGTVYIDYPIESDGSFLGAVGGSVFCDDFDGSDYYGALYRSTVSRAGLRAYEVSGSYIRGDVVNATTPFTWTTGDRLVIEDFYRPA